MKLLGKLLAGIAAIGAVSTISPAMATSFFGQVPVGYSANVFQVGTGSSWLTININALGTRDSNLCAFCNSSYSDNFTVKMFNQSGDLLSSINASNYFYSSLYGSSKGIGAAPVWIALAGGTTKIEVVSQLFVSGLLGTDGNQLNFGNLNLFSDGAIAAATPIPSSLPLLATALAIVGFLGWRKMRTPDLAARPA